LAILVSSVFVQTIVCFANSRKNGHRCVAGKTWSRAGRGEWVRPVSQDRSRALKPSLLAYQNGIQPALLDIVDVPLEAALPEGHQHENMLTSEAFFWSRSGRLRWGNIGLWLDTPAQLWSLHSQSWGMLNNRVAHGGVAIDSSLQLVAVPRLLLKLMHSPHQNDPRRHVVVGEFDYHGASYRLHVTDPLMEAQCRARPERCMEILQPVLCVSLGECFRQHCYKLIAGVLFERRFS